MSHDRGCHCGREKYEYQECPIDNCQNRIERGVKCIVNGCTNRTHEGTFVGHLCYPCYKTITTGEIIPSNSFIGRLKHFYDTKSKAHAERLADLSRANLEVERLQNKCDQQADLLRQLVPDKYPGVLFIAGHIGEKDQNGMPAGVILVPSYGASVNYLYVKKDVSE